MVKCQLIVDAMNRIAPKRLAEEWDNPGLLVGSPEQEVRRVLICLDVTEDAVEQAVEAGAELIIAHHPLIFRPIHHLRTDLPLGRRIQKLMQHGIAVFAAHTNLDSAKGGVNDVLAKRLGLSDIRLLERTEDGMEAVPSLGRMGELAESLSAKAFAAHVKKSLSCGHVRLVESGSHPVQRVAVCGGSAADLIPKAAFLGADTYVTGDVRYHDAQKAMEESLKTTTLADIAEDTKQAVGNESNEEKE